MWEAERTLLSATIPKMTPAAKAEGPRIRGCDHRLKNRKLFSESRRDMGFPHDIKGRDVARFLIEQGLEVLEKRRGAKGAESKLREKQDSQAA
jgi:hypothetical protein